MPQLKLYKLDDENYNTPISTLSRGEHIIGRGPLLQCNDKRVSRKHAIINVTEDNVSIEAVHVNPLFFMAADSKTVTILPKNQPVNISDGDKFALLTDLFWFRAKILQTDIVDVENLTVSNDQTSQNNITETLGNGTSYNKRSLQNNSNGENCKKLKMDENVNGETSGNNTEINTNSFKKETVSDDDDDDGVCDSSSNVKVENSPVVKPEQVSDDEDEANISLKQEQGLENEDENKADKVKEEKKRVAQDNEQSEGTSTEKKSDNEKDEASTSNNTSKKQRRERCWFGPTCYRKNPRHREDFSHEGDEDYDSDPNDDRPTCSFGGACYRRNRDHRREYKHPNRPASRPNNMPGVPKKRTAAAKKPKYTDTPEDDYDYDDPFIDDSSDEYEMSDDDSDTDWEDSQNVEEDSQDRRRLLREANKFTRGGKK